jgi:protein-export membrane protein SecD
LLAWVVWSWFSFSWRFTIDFAGILADLALNGLYPATLAAFNLLGVTLTLPGIAGFILSIGMAVDANVLIFERTREELRSGKSLYRSVESGFYRAFSSILDSNVTTLISCGALFWLGAGSSKRVCPNPGHRGSDQHVYRFNLQSHPAISGPEHASVSQTNLVLPRVVYGSI